ncbi:hypothetical protein [Streptomyces sp. SAS_276]|uniref:hypothetical protein n=1 Tax=Streptomyces sp. SAS_276 TaxID=3412745 RepID=UPI00403D0765
MGEIRERVDRQRVEPPLDRGERQRQGLRDESGLLPVLWTEVPPRAHVSSTRFRTTGSMLGA